MKARTAQERATVGPTGRVGGALWLVFAAVFAAIDLVTKSRMEDLLLDGQVVELGIVNLQLGYNTGVAFSLGDALPPWVIVGFTGIITALLGWYLWHQASARCPRLQLAGLTLILGGALGNLIDRADGAGVVDYFHTGWFPTFNLADVLITLGAATVAVSALFPNRSSSVANQDQKQKPDDEPAGAP